MTNTPSLLDPDELLHLAINAAGRDAHGDAIEYLKQALQCDPEHANARYLLGAEYAQIAMYDRAVEEMQRALVAAPDLHIARFQLGLLQITAGDAAQAAQSWQALEALGDGHPLFQFTRGLLCMANGDFASCQAHLNKGIALNRDNPALNADMQRMLEQLPVGAAAETEAADANPFYLSAYTGGTSH